MFKGFVFAFSLVVTSLWAVSGGSLSGTVRDTTGGVLPGARLSLVNTALKVEIRSVADSDGFYAFPALAVGHYDLTIEAQGFRSQKKTGISVDADSAVRIDTTLEIAQQNEAVTVAAEETQLETHVEAVTTHLGEVVGGAQIEALPLNGRSYTDLLAIQPGVSPATTLTPTSVIMAGVTGTINPSGDLNPGNVSIDGQRESANGFMVNAIDVQEHMNGGTSVIPNLDSIEEFRVLTNNFDPEYGNYNGGMINVVTKSGGDAFHFGAFEFLRNTALDAKNYFDDTRGVFRQNQFGGTAGGPVKRQKVFFFTDYQGTRTVEGITSPTVIVPSLANRSGNLSDVASSLSGTVSGDYTAALLSRALGYAVTADEPYYAPGCTAPAACVLPNATIPQRAWSSPAQHLLQYIPTANIGANQFSTSAYSRTVRDDKAAGRLDAGTRFGQLSGYYFLDDYRLDNPYPAQQGGATVPGFDALTVGRAQMWTLSDTKVLGATTVNEFHAGFLRNVNVIGEPHGGTGVSLKSQGFLTGAGTPGITVQAPQFEGVENIVFPSFVMGVPVTNSVQANNTIFLSDSVSKVFGTHSLKFGGQFHNDQVNNNPNATFNGTFTVTGTETGSAFADFLLGFASNFTQSAGQHFYLRNHYTGLFAEDSWRARPNLTVNYGVRWDLIEPWSEKFGSLQTVIPGRQSVLFPNATPGLVVPGDPGIPGTLSPPRYRNFAPRLGVAWSPKFESPVLKFLAGDAGKSSIRASFGMFYTAFPGLSAGIMYGVPPFGYNYLSPAPPLLATPFVSLGDGTQNTNPFPLAYPPHNVSAANPFSGFDFAAASPISAAPYWDADNKVPYTENYMISIQREIGTGALLTLSYVGNQGHHILVVVPTNTGNAALCLSLPACGPFAENGARTGLGANYGPVTAQKSIGNSNFNALEANLRFVMGKRATLLVGYTWSKSIDDASNLGEQVNPFNDRLTRVISSWDMPHNFVATYHYNLPWGWSVSGTTRLSSGFPVTLFDDSDRSLLGTLGNGVNNQLLDTPQYLGGPLQINTNPRNGQPAFNAAAFATETLGVLGNAPRRMFHGPGIMNFDAEVSRSFRLGEKLSLDLRIEAFNVFNHAQFCGPASVDGEVNDANFGHVVSAAAPRLMQAAVKVHF